MIIGYVAIPSKGKTLAAVQQAILLVLRNWYLGNTEYKLYANIDLTLPKRLQKAFVKITSYSQVKELENGVFLFDEMWTWVDSRISQSKQNRFWSMWSIKTRKAGIDLLYTEQYELLIDVRIREITEYIARPYQHTFDGEATALSKYRQPVYKYTIVTLESVKNPSQGIKEYAILNKSFFGLYDTFEEPDDLEGGSYVDEGNEIIPKLMKDDVVDLYETKGEIIGHVKAFYKCSDQTAIYVYRKVYGDKKIRKSSKRTKRR
jgi:hypothetical protein